MAIMEDGYRPGALAELMRLHMNACSDALDRVDAEATGGWSAGGYEAALARNLAEFFDRMDPERDLFYCLWRQERMLGAITLDADGASPDSRYAGAHLRWFVVTPALAGSGLERHFLTKAMRFAAERRYPRVWAETLEGVGPSDALYHRFGFNMVRESAAKSLGGVLNVKRWEARYPFTRRAETVEE